MLDGLFIASLVGSCVQAIKEACIPTIPAENWANKELYNKDIMDGVPIEQCLKNANNGKYKLAKAYPEPHRDASGKIVSVLRGAGNEKVVTSYAKALDSGEALIEIPSWVIEDEELDT